MSDKIEAEILDVLGEEVAAAVDTPLVVIEGTKGDPGKDGITPTIGDNGNWYLGTTDTGKPSRGATGAPGKDGADGKPGAAGADGAPGIYYGTTQPTGDTRPVWIDPDGDHDDGGLLPAVTDADNGKVLRVVSSAWAAEDMPTGGTDMGITGAKVGQIAKITAVDASGTPTAWSPVDMPSGGGGLKLIAHLELTEDVTPTASAWTSFADGEAFGTLKRIIFSGKIVGASVSTTEGAARPVLNGLKLQGCPYVGQKAGNKRWWMCEIDIGEHFSKIKSSLSNAIPPNSTTTFSWSLNVPVYFLQQEIQSIGLNFLSSTATGFGPGTDLYVWGEKA